VLNAQKLKYIEVYNFFSVLYLYEMLSLAVKGERRLRIFGRGILRGMFGPYGYKEINTENCIMRSFVICTSIIILLS
jgi:hypothetical protein